MSVEHRRIHFEITRPAVNRPALRWIERHGGGLATLRAVYGDLDALSNSRCLGRSNRGKPFVLCLLTLFTTLWRVQQVLVAKESLFAGGPNE